MPVWKIRALISGLLVAILLGAAVLPGASLDDPWIPGQTVQPAELAKELQQEKDPYPTVIYVGVKALYEGAHIPGAVFYGPGSTEPGLAELKKFADASEECGPCALLRMLPAREMPESPAGVYGIESRRIRTAARAAPSDQL
jgi:hypothetical protein